MNILKLTDKPTELEAVKDKVLEELQYLRSLDTAGDGKHRLAHVRTSVYVGLHLHSSNPDLESSDQTGNEKLLL